MNSLLVKRSLFIALFTISDITIASAEPVDVLLIGSIRKDSAPVADLPVRIWEANKKWEATRGRRQNWSYWNFWVRAKIEIPGKYMVFVMYNGESRMWPVSIGGLFNLKKKKSGDNVHIGNFNIEKSTVAEEPQTTE